MKLGQLIEYNKRNIFFQKLWKKWARETSSRPLYIFKKCLIWGKSKWSASPFQYILIALNLWCNKSKLYKTLDYWSREICSILIFAEKGPGLVSPPHFMYDFSKNCFQSYILLADQISLSDCLYYSRYWAICVLQFFVNQAVTS